MSLNQLHPVKFNARKQFIRIHNLMLQLRYRWPNMQRCTFLIRQQMTREAMLRQQQRVLFRDSQRMRVDTIRIDRGVMMVTIRAREEKVEAIVYRLTDDYRRSEIPLQQQQGDDE